MKFTENIKNNTWPLITILCFLLISLAAILGDEFKNIKDEKSFKDPIRIGLFKQGDDQPFQELKNEILSSIPKKANIRVVIREISEFDEACRLMQENKLEILGEVTPNIYIDRNRECNFIPLIGIEYQNSPYYRSVLFSSIQNEMCGLNYSRKANANNLGEALNILRASSNNNCKVAYVKNEDSTSRYYYPVSYLMDKNISVESMQPLTNDRAVFESIIQNGSSGKSEKYVAGFLPDYKYKMYMNENDDTKEKVIVLDTTDPIPNGLFVVRNGVFTKNNGDIKEEILNVWKGIRNIGKEGSMITGWRTGQSLLRDLELVKFHKLKVDNKDKLKGNYKKITSVVFVVVITLILLSTTILLGWKK